MKNSEVILIIHPELEKFLKAKNCLEAFKKNVRNQLTLPIKSCNYQKIDHVLKQIREGSLDCINTSFSWAQTTDGNNWNRINNLWMDIRGRTIATKRNVGMQDHIF